MLQNLTDTIQKSTKSIKNMFWFGIVGLIIVTNTTQANHESQSINKVLNRTVSTATDNSVKDTPNTPTVESLEVKNQGIIKVEAEEAGVEIIQPVELKIEPKKGCTATQSHFPKKLNAINTTLVKLTSLGLSCQGAVVLTGNFLQESSLNSYAENSIKCIGITQWCGSRRGLLEQKCNPLGDLECQLEFLVSELKARKQYEAFTGDNTQLIKDTLYSYVLWCRVDLGHYCPHGDETGKRYIYSKFIWAGIE